jgi:hypothetical protein
MGAFDPQIRVGTSGTTPALGRNYSTGAAVAGHVFTSAGPDSPPNWQPNAVGLEPINRVLFVDRVNSPGATANGTIGAPFRTIQQAIDHAVALAWDNFQVQIAPGIYPENITVTEFPLLWVVLSGWSTGEPFLALTEITGDITFVTGVNATCIVTLENLAMNGALITTDQPNHDLELYFRNALCTANITGFNLTLDSTNSVLSGDITAGGGLDSRWDAISWYWKVSNNLFITVAGVYSREFRGVGANEYNSSLVVNGLAIGATAFVDLAIPDVRAGDYGILQITTPVATDYVAGFHSSTAGSMKFWITNLTRNPGNFSELCQVCILHNNMAVQAPP